MELNRLLDAGDAQNVVSRLSSSATARDVECDECDAVDVDGVEAVAVAVAAAVTGVASSTRVD